jgi:hypothetical protein
MVRYIGMDVHREFAQLAVVEDGLVRDEGRIGVTPEAPIQPVSRPPSPTSRTPSAPAWATRSSANCC